MPNRSGNHPKRWAAPACYASAVQLAENISLAPLTTFGIGGPSRSFCRAECEADIEAAWRWSREQNLPLLVLGGGSNLLISDEGFPGLTLQIALQGREREAATGRVQAAAGENWDDFVAWCVGQDLAGVECLSGIPGTVGGTPVQNVGAYGQEVAETIRRVRAWDRETGAWVELDHEACHFAYRRSLFNSTARDRYIVTRVWFELQPGGAPSLRYPELQRKLAEHPAPGLQQVRDAVREIRRGKAMLLVEGEVECHSAGSFFKNPVVAKERLEEIGQRAGAAPPQFPAGDGQVKIPAAWLIERAGFSKGFRPRRSDGSLSPAGISSRHALALVNYGNARAADVIALKEQIQQTVAARFGVELHPEPVMGGFGRTAAGSVEERV